MKAKLLTSINAILVFLLGILGFTSCESAQKYGPDPDYPVVKYGSQYVSGVTNPAESFDGDAVRIGTDSHIFDSSKDWPESESSVQ